MDGCHSSIDDKKKVYVAEAAEEGPAEVALAEFAAVGRVRVPHVCATPSQQSAQSRALCS